MPATLVFHETGSQYSIDNEGVWRVTTEYRITRKRYNGSQAQFTCNDAEYPFSIVVNVPSEAYDTLDATYLRDRKGSKR